MEWGKSVVPLVSSGKVRVHGRCVAAPENLQMLQDVVLYVR
jgi:DNA repair protein RAD5